MTIKNHYFRDTSIDGLMVMAIINMAERRGFNIDSDNPIRDIRRIGNRTDIYLNEKPKIIEVNISVNLATSQEEIK
jgi:hypothetical protein